MKKIAVLGAGNGGYACSADLSLAGYEVNLYETPRFRENIEPILERGGIEISGAAREGFAKLNKVTTDIKEAVKDVELILIVVPAFAQKYFVESCIPYLEGGQCIVFLGKGGGTLEFAEIAKKLGFKKDVLLGEANTLPYATRRTGLAKVEVFCRVKKLFVAALPAMNNQKLVNVLKEIYPFVVPVSNVLETMLNDINGILHPVPTILNAGRIEYTKGEFYVYREGFTPAIMKVIEAIDKERLQVVKALGLKRATFEELYLSVGFGPEAPLLESITHCYGASNMKSPGSLQSRYLTEDVPYGLVPMASLGQFVGVETPTIKSIIKLASIVNQTDYWQHGRTVEKLGIAQMNISELQRFVTEGEVSHL